MGMDPPMLGGERAISEEGRGDPASLLAKTTRAAPFLSRSPCAGTSGDAFQLHLSVFANFSRPRLPSDTLLCSAGGGCP